jgi:hypothetical protein
MPGGVGDEPEYTATPAGRISGSGPCCGFGSDKIDAVGTESRRVAKQEARTSMTPTQQVEKLMDLIDDAYCHGRQDQLDSAYRRFAYWKKTQDEVKAIIATTVSDDDVILGLEDEPTVRPETSKTTEYPIPARIGSE